MTSTISINLRNDEIIKIVMIINNKLNKKKVNIICLSDFNTIQITNE